MHEESRHLSCSSGFQRRTKSPWSWRTWGRKNASPSGDWTTNRSDIVWCRRWGQSQSSTGRVKGRRNALWWWGRERSLPTSDQTTIRLDGTTRLNAKDLPSPEGYNENEQRISLPRCVVVPHTFCTHRKRWEDCRVRLARQFFHYGQIDFANTIELWTDLDFIDILHKGAEALMRTFIKQGDKITCNGIHELNTVRIWENY